VKIFEDSHHLPAHVKASREIHRLLRTMKVGEKITPERTLCQTLGVSRVTLRRALQTFFRQGILTSHGAGGTVLVREVSEVPQDNGSFQDVIGLVVPTLNNTMISRIVSGAEKAATEKGSHLLVATDDGNLDLQITQIQRLLERGIGSLAIYPDSSNLQREEFQSLLLRIKKRGTPLVMIDRYLPEIEAACVLSDNFAGMYAATQHMIMSGFRKLALLSFGEEGGVADRDRRKGFFRALQDQKLEFNPLLEARLGARNHEMNGRKVVSEWLQNPGLRNAFDGIVCLQDNMAYGAFLALQEVGLVTGRDIGLVGYDNLDRELYAAVGLHLTSVDHPAEKIGAEAVRLLVEKIQETAPQNISPCLALMPRLVIRQSCGSPTSLLPLEQEAEKNSELIGLPK
jgi:DNA-binding LacI/PurR family transcriptional regulator